MSEEKKVQDEEIADIPEKDPSSEEAVKADALLKEESEAEEKPAEGGGTEEEAAEKSEAPDEEASNEDASEPETPAEEGGEDANGKAEAGKEESGSEAAKTAEGKKEFDFFGRKKKFEKELAKKAEEIAAISDQYKRLLAEFDNFRKRTEKEKSGMYAMGARDVVEKMLPVVDNFERGFSLVAEEDKDDPFTSGMEKIYKQLTGVLTELGVTPIEAVGKPFDPNLHNAVMHVEDEALGENTVAEEFQKGYLYKDQVVRYSMVKVAN